MISSNIIKQCMEPLNLSNVSKGVRNTNVVDYPFFTTVNKRDVERGVLFSVIFVSSVKRLIYPICITSMGVSLYFRSPIINFIQIWIKPWTIS